ncbi:TetR family transcriptional regulator [Corynebacterium freneyi]|uniref:TetR/AcrR family transcriptional regulator n=1 Tax=Corynebacterium freneyi TaxID=134034 RepID=UPI0025502053|nr:TetR family transcriptional regulator [Corynebacterium freneyi]MDK8768494.1 TetR family transcriptional regulator [Corynebacterium freneyi]
MDSDTSRPRRQNSAATRARIVEVAADYFTRKPFAKVSLKEIASEAGVSAPLIIKYFRTKEGLLEELINFTPMKDLICEAAFEDIGATLADDAINGDRSSTGSLIALLMATAGSPAAVKTATDQFQEVIGGALFDRIRDEAPAVNGDEDAEQRCQYALAMYTGLGTVLVSYARGIPSEGADAVKSYGAHIQRVLETPTEVPVADAGD